MILKLLIIIFLIKHSYQECNGPNNLNICCDHVCEKCGKCYNVKPDDDTGINQYYDHLNHLCCKEKILESNIYCIDGVTTSCIIDSPRDWELIWNFIKPLEIWKKILLGLAAGIVLLFIMYSCCCAWRRKPPVPYEYIKNK